MTDNSTETTQDNATLMVRERNEALAANPGLAEQISAIEILKQRAAILLASGLLPDSIKNWQQATAIMMRAEELDVDYWTGLMHLNAIKGAPQPDGQLCMALILRSELMEDYQIIETTDTVCTIRMKRVGQPAFIVSCTFQEYERLAGPDARRQPKTHLFWYTYKQGARRLFSDVLNNMNPKAPRRERIIVDDDLPGGLPEDRVFINEEGEDKPTATLPLSPTPTEPSEPAPDKSEVADSVEADGLSVGQVYENFAAGVDEQQIGGLDLNSLQKRALRAKVVDNEFHFQNLLKQMLADGVIREGTTADKILDAMRKHKAEKELAEAVDGEVVGE